MVRRTEGRSNPWASRGRDLVDKRSDNQILRNQSYILIPQFARQVPQLYLLSGNILVIFLAIKLDWSVYTCLTQLYYVREMHRIYYIQNNYMFRHFKLAILRLSNEKNLVSSYTLLM